MARIRMRRKRKKSRKLYGSRYHGYGQVGEHKGSGQKGGKGKAGGKNHLKIKLLKEGHIFGSRGFTHKGTKLKISAINVGELVELIKDGKLEASKEGETYVVEMNKIGYNKLLGRGKVDIPLKVVFEKEGFVSEKAKEKIENAGGAIVLPAAE